MGLWARRSPPPLFFSCSHVKCKRVFPIPRIDKFSRLFAVLQSCTHRSVNLKHPVSGPHCGGLSGFLGSERNDRWIQQPQGKSDLTSKTYNRAGARSPPSSFQQQVPPYSRLSGSQSLGPGHSICFSVTWDRESPPEPPLPHQGIPFLQITPQSHKHRNLCTMSHLPRRSQASFQLQQAFTAYVYPAFNLLVLPDMIYKKRKKMEEEEEKVREIQNKRRLKGDHSNYPNCPELSLSQTQEDITGFNNSSFPK